MSIASLVDQTVDRTHASAQTMCPKNDNNEAPEPPDTAKEVDIEHNEDNHDDKTCPFESVWRQLSVRGRPREGRTLLLTRHGESEYNLDERIGGDPNITTRGHMYAVALADYLNALELPSLKVWTSSLRRTHQTARLVSAESRLATSLLDELSCGTMDGLTYSEVESRHPLEWAARVSSKWLYRYPKGESYLDCCRRLIPLLMQMEETEETVLVVSHQATLRCLFGFLLRRPASEIPYIKIPQHTLIRVVWDGESNVIDFIRIPVPHVEHSLSSSDLGGFQLEAGAAVVN